LISAGFLYFGKLFAGQRKILRAFAGDEVSRAKYYPEDSEFLLEFEPEVAHYEVVGHAADGAMPLM